MPHPILEQYDKSIDKMRNFSDRILVLLNGIFSAHLFVPHSTSSRVKSRTSLSDKISLKDKSFINLIDVTDIVGLRVITYLPEDVALVSQIIEKEFDIDRVNSVDKRQLLAPDRFGYLSVHYVASLRKDRAQLIEYKDYSNLKCEIQIRSILQHAWAEIQHDLGYKAKGEVPSEIKRRFYRLASLLEIADDEFSRLRLELTGYQTSIRNDIKQNKLNIELNLESLSAFVHSSSLVKEIDKEISRKTKTRLSNDDYDVDSIDQLHYFGITTIQELEHVLEKNKILIPELAYKVCGTEDDFEQTGYFKMGICIDYLFYLLATENGTLDAVRKFLTVKYSGDSNTDFAKELVSYRKEIDRKTA